MSDYYVAKHEGADDIREIVSKFADFMDMPNGQYPGEMILVNPDLEMTVCDLDELMQKKTTEAYEAGRKAEWLRVKKSVGMLRQWLNEERIKDRKKLVSNEQIEVWLAMGETE